MTKFALGTGVVIWPIVWVLFVLIPLGAVVWPLLLVVPIVLALAVAVSACWLLLLLLVGTFRGLAFAVAAAGPGCRLAAHGLGSGARATRTGVVFAVDRGRPLLRVVSDRGDGGAVIAAGRAALDVVDVAWCDAGFARKAAAHWQRCSFSPAAARAWSNAGFEPAEARAWRARGFTSGRARAWRARDASLGGAAEWTLGASPILIAAASRSRATRLPGTPGLAASAPGSRWSRNGET